MAHYDIPTPNGSRGALPIAKDRKNFRRGTGTQEPRIEEGQALAAMPGVLGFADGGSPKKDENGWIVPGTALDTIVKNVDISRPSPESVQGWLQPGSALHSLVTGAPDAGTPAAPQVGRYASEGSNDVRGYPSGPTNVAQGPGQTTEQATVPAPARPAPVATPSVGRYPSEGSNDPQLRGYPSGPTPANTVAGSASGTGPNGQPMTREYTSGDLAQKATYGVSGGGGIGADGMTDAQRMNAPFHQAYTQMQAEKKAQDASQAQFINDQAQRQQRIAAGPGYRDLEMAKSAARVAGFRATDGADMVLRGGSRRERMAINDAAQAAGGRVGQLEAQAQAANISPRRDLVAEQIAQQHGADTSAVTQLGAAQTALMNPLAVQAQKQATSSAGTLQDIGKITLAEHKLRQDLLKEYATPGTTPDRQAQIHDALLAQSNRDRPVPALFGHASGGSHPDDPTRRLPDVIYDVRTGKPVAAPSAPAAAGGPTDGEIRVDPTTGKRGKFDAKQGKWVPA